MYLEDTEELAAYWIEHWLPHQGYSFKWMKTATGKSTIGRCVYRSKQIQLARPYAEANGFDEVRETIFHEIAHALAYIHDADTGHGSAWRYWATQVGAKPVTCFAKHSIKYANTGKYYECWFCLNQNHTYARKMKHYGLTCGQCGEQMEWVVE